MTAYVLPRICDKLKFHDTTRQEELAVDMLLSCHLTVKALIQYDEGTEVLETHLGQCYIPQKDTTPLFGGDITLASVSNEELKTQMDNFWKCEMAGLNQRETHDEILSEHREAYDQLNDKMIIKDGKYHMPLLFKSTAKPFRNNYILALARLKSLERKLKKRPELHKEYVTNMKVYLDKFASRVPDNEIEQKECCYLPHNYVLRDSTTTKLRIVHDAAAKGPDGFSINDCLLAGPPLQPDIVGILLRFRLNKIALVCDISKMFFQIANLKEDKKWHRFLWRENFDDKIEHWNMDVTTFGFIDSPFKAIYAVRDNLIKTISTLPVTDKNKAMVKAATDALINMYVDDFISGRNNLKEAHDLFNDLNDIFDRAGFPLRKWLSNDSKLMALIPEELRGETKVKVSLTDVKLDANEMNLTKALGVEWDTENDRLTYDSFSDLSIAEKVTKRVMLSTTARLFDPLGGVSPFVLRGKILAQECWKEKLDWDEEVPAKMAKEWRQWAEQIKDLSKVHMPRCVKQHEVKKQELHCFTDASEKAIGAVVYLKVFYVNGKIDSNLIVAKGKVASVKEITLPRKELNAVVLGAKLVSHAAKELNINDRDIYCHTDSLTAWQWLQKTPTDWKIYVKNRVLDVQSLIKKDHIFHVPGVQNPADLVSRGTEISKLDSFWFKGPTFMTTPALHAPQKQSLETEECKLEKNKSKSISLLTKTDPTEEFKDIIKTSNYKSFLRRTAYMTRMTDACLSRGSGQRPKELKISTEELLEAEYFWIRQAQQTAYPTEYNRLSYGHNIQQGSKLTTLAPFLDNKTGVMRCKSRLVEGNVTFEQAHPAILPRPNVTNLQSINQDFIARFIYENHMQTQHAGANWLHTHLRANGYWIVGGIKQVRKVISRCISCQKAIKQPETQAMGQLPEYRLKENVKPFTFTGVDAAGPIYLTDPVDPTSQKKGYIIVFTCLTSRAVHLELTLSQKAEDFMACIRLLIARRGEVQEFLSDNYRTHKRMDLELSTLFAACKKENEENGKIFKWRFIPDCAPWFGATYERIIRTIKETMRKVLGSAYLNEYEMRPLLAEIEAMLNDRPLAQMDSSSDSIQPITPSMIMTGHRLGSLPNLMTKPKMTFENQTKYDIQMTWKKRQSLLTQTWNKWRKEYMLSLHRTPKWQAEKPDLKEGEVVLIMTEKLARGEWPLAIVVKNEGVHSLRDRQTDKVRAVCLRLSNGKIIKRPIRNLVALECT